MELINKMQCFCATAGFSFIARWFYEWQHITKSMKLFKWWNWESVFKYKIEVCSTQASCPLNYELKKKKNNNKIPLWLFGKVKLMWWLQIWPNLRLFPSIHTFTPDERRFTVQGFIVHLIFTCILFLYSKNLQSSQHGKSITQWTLHKAKY